MKLSSADTPHFFSSPTSDPNALMRVLARGDLMMTSDPNEMVKSFVKGGILNFPLSSEFVPLLPHRKKPRINMYKG